jgi:hypothetical protein
MYIYIYIYIIVDLDAEVMHSQTIHRQDTVRVPQAGYGCRTRGLHYGVSGTQLRRLQILKYKEGG